ncbi:MULTISPECIES: type III secretion system translocon subunit SctE [Providencia]|uniref:type III secretion system translocon subunit SctE n=2 Tax=Morganellaceae TaxID=1903414 RepID=UPI001E30723E|nr:MULTISPECIES: type III secretion system translocon subunit SctE [Providencia]
MSQVTTPNTLNSAGNERINNIRTFLQGNHPLGLGEESAKALLALEEACGELASSEQMKRQRAEHIPQLVRPKMSAMKMSPEAQQEKGFNANAVLIDTFATLRQLLFAGNLTELSNRLQLLNIESAALREKGALLLDSFAVATEQLNGSAAEFDTQKNQLLAAKNALHSLKTQQQTSQLSIKQNQDELAQRQSQLNENKASLAQLSSLPNTPETDSAQLMLQANIAELTHQIQPLQVQNHQLTENLRTLNSQVTTCHDDINVLQSKLEVIAEDAAKLAQNADIERQKLNQFIETAPRPTEVDGDKWENTIALLTMLTATLKKAMNEDSIRNLKEQEEVMMKVSEAARKDSDKKAKEAAEAERKAADANKAASCASKIFSYVMLAISVIATVATFGAAAPLTLAVAAIGIALAVTDIVLEETGQGSLMQMLAAEISSAVTDMLVAFGVPEEEAKRIGSIVGMVLAAIAFLAISLLSMSSFVKNIANTVTNVTKMLAKNVGTILKSAIKSMPKSFTNALGNMATKGAKVGQSAADNADEMVKLTKLTKLADKFDDAQEIAKSVEQVGSKVDDVKDIAKTVKDVAANSKTQSVTMARLEVGMKGTGAGLSVANAATTGGLRLSAAAQHRDMKEMLAGMMLNSEVIQALEELLNALIKSVSKNYEQLDEMFTTMMNSLNRSNSNKVDMLKTARFA